MGAVRTGEITALTGLRIVAALWVVLFHFRPLLWEASPRLQDDVAPLLDAGAQGVDLFFILSGFVLTWNYLDRMGPTWSGRATLHFLWLRLSRVWPVYLVTMHLAALWIVFTLHVGDVPSPDADKLTAISYVRQFFMVQLWFEPFFDGTSWDGPAWSISAEWLAYLIFGALVLVIFRIAAVSRARVLFALAALAALPPILLLLASGVLYTPWSWLPRIIAQFTAGALACAAVRRLRISDRGRRVAGYLSVLLGGALVGGLYYYAEHPVPGMVDSGALVSVLFLPLVVALSVGAGTLPALLSTPVFSYGGKISFSLYMIHEPVHTAWNWAVAQYQIVLPKSVAKVVVVGLIAVAVLLAMLLYHVVEEPARRWMRRMIDTGDVRQAPGFPAADDAAGSESSGALRGAAAGIAAITLLIAMHGGTGTPAARAATVSEIAIIGDSYTAGSGEGGNGPQAWTEVARQLLAAEGVDLDAAIAAEGGAGYGRRGNEGSVFIDLAARAVRPGDKLVLFFGSRNDQPVDPQRLPGLAADAFRLARMTAPAAKLLVIGPPWPTAYPPPEVLTIRDRLREQAVGAGAVFVDPIAEGWFVGRPDLIGADGIHPTDAGHAYMAARIAPLIYDQLTVRI